MKRNWIMALGIMLLAVQVSAGETPVIKTHQDKESYGIGVSTARNFKRQGIEVDLDTFIGPNATLIFELELLAVK